MPTSKLLPHKAVSCPPYHSELKSLERWVSREALEQGWNILYCCLLVDMVVSITLLFVVLVCLGSYSWMCFLQASNDDLILESCLNLHSKVNKTTTNQTGKSYSIQFKTVVLATKNSVQGRALRKLLGLPVRSMRWFCMAAVFLGQAVCPLSRGQRLSIHVSQRL